MPRQANGNYLPPANTAAVSGTSISSTAFNTLETDIGTEITNSVDRGGRSAMTAPLPMGGQKITGMADPTVATDGATKAYADALVASFFSTGDIKPTLKVVADTGWLMFADQTIGNAGSGATYANANALALYTLIWNNISSPSANAFAAVTGGLGASAAADWAGLKPMLLLKTLGRLWGTTGNGAGLLGLTHGGFAGANTQTLALNNLPINALGVTVSGTVSVTSAVANIIQGSITTVFQSGTSGSFPQMLSGAAAGSVSSSGSNTLGGVTGSMNGGVTQQPFSITPPLVAVNWMVKL